MQPIFPEYIKFLEDHGCDTSWYKERIFWMDNNIVKAIKSGGQIVSLYRVYVDDSLNVSLKKHRDNKREFEIETWDETIQRNLEHLRELEQESIQLLRDNAFNTERRIINLSSTGKDSMVVTKLAQKAGLEFETYFNVTTLDVKESNRMAKENGYIHILPNPKYKGFYDYIQRYNTIPSRLNRFCCTYYKESPTVDYFPANEKLMFLFGMRNQESIKRSNYQDVWRNEKWENRDWIGILPIRKWSEFDVWLYILTENIEINPKYKYGYDRVGCGIACPNYTKYTWVLDKYWYPYLFNRWREIVRNDFIRNNKWLIMNCTIEEYVAKAWTGGVYRTEPTEEVIVEYAQYSGLELDVARKYFNRYCANGCLNSRRQPLRIKDKNALAMNMKMFGRNVEKFKCKKCLMQEFSWDQERWDQQVQEFKKQGCKLF